MDVSAEEAALHFAQLLEKAEMGEAVTIFRDGQAVARLKGCERPNTLPRIGALKGQIKIADNFDEPLDDF